MNTDTKNNISKTDREILELETTQDKLSIKIGKQLLYIQKNETFKNDGFKSYTSWFKHFLTISSKGKTFLSESLSIAKMLDATAKLEPDLAIQPSAGLYTISQIFRVNQNAEEAIQYIKQLNCGTTDNDELKKIKNTLSNTDTDQSELNNDRKNQSSSTEQDSQVLHEKHNKNGIRNSIQSNAHWFLTSFALVPLYIMVLTFYLGDK